MEICTHCQKNNKIVDIFVFTPGKDTDGIHNICIVGKLCSNCFQQYNAGDTTTVQIESTALTIEELL